MASREYEDYLQSEAWSNRRNHRLAISGRACAVCRSKKNLHVHHLTYARIFNEDNADLMPLCDYHHTEAERLIKDGRLSRTGNPLHLAAETIRLLCNPAPVRLKRQKEKKVHRRANGVKTRNMSQDALMREDWFVAALSLSRHAFKVEVRRRFDGHQFRGKLITNAFTLYDRNKRSSEQRNKELVGIIFNHSASEPPTRLSEVVL